MHLRGLRLALGLTTRDLAERTGLAVALLEDVELGRDELQREVLAEIAGGLGMTTGTILRLWERRVVITARPPD